MAEKSRQGNSANLEDDHAAVLAEFEQATADGDEERIRKIISSNPTLLHLVAKNDSLKVVEQLLRHGASVNAVDKGGITPLHIAAQYASKEVVSVLLKNGAMFDAVDDLGTKSVDIANNEEIKNLLQTTESVYESVVSNSLADVVKHCIAGAILDAKNSEGNTALHQAVQRGSEKVVKILLRNGAQVNVHGSEGFTPLHFAVKMSHISIARLLLFHGASFEAVDENGKPPSFFCVDRDLSKLFKLIRNCFKKIKRNDKSILRDSSDGSVICDFHGIKDKDTVKALLGAKNGEGRDLTLAMVLEGFKERTEFHRIVQVDVFDLEANAVDLMKKGNYKEALEILKAALEKRVEVLGSNNIFTLETREKIACILQRLGFHSESFKMYEEICLKLTEMLGYDSPEALSSRLGMALNLYRTSKFYEAMVMFDSAHKKLSELFGPNHSETLKSLFHKGLALLGLHKIDEALHIFESLLSEQTKRLKGGFSPFTLTVQSNIGSTLRSLDRWEEALKIYEDVFNKRKQCLGLNHEETMRSKYEIALIRGKMGKRSDAIKAFEEVLRFQTTVFPANHVELLSTKHWLARFYMAEKEDAKALIIFKQILELDVDDGIKQDCLKQIELLNRSSKLAAGDVAEFNNRGIKSAIISNDKSSFSFFVYRDTDFNQPDVNGRSLLHLAADHDRSQFADELITNGADLSHASVKGNTALHTATLRGSLEMVALLLYKAERLKLNSFIDAQTTSTATTALHVAAKNGLFDIVAMLLVYGANREVVNKDGQRPIDLATDEKVKTLLKSERVEDVVKVEKFTGFRIF